jgi:hypothetical protein
MRAFVGRAGVGERWHPGYRKQGGEIPLCPAYSNKAPTFMQDSITAIGNSNILFILVNFLSFISTFLLSYYSIAFFPSQTIGKKLQ